MTAAQLSHARLLRAKCACVPASVCALHAPGGRLIQSCDRQQQAEIACFEAERMRKWMPFHPLAAGGTFARLPRVRPLPALQAARSLARRALG